MQMVTVKDSWGGTARRVVFSVVAAAVALVAGFLLVACVFLTFIALFAPAYSSPWLLVLWIPCVLWFGFLARSAAAKDSWVGAAKRIGFLVMATTAALVAGISLAASVVVALIVEYDGGSSESNLRSSDRYYLLLALPPLLLLFAVAIAASVWLARRSRISRPWFPWFLLGVGPALPALFALTFRGD